MTDTSMDSMTRSTPWHLWVVGVVSLLWNGFGAYDFLGSPEGELALAQAVVHLATAPKSVAVYEAFKAARRAAAETGSLTPPAHIRNAPTKLMKQLGYGKGYQYDPDTPEGFSGANFFPDEMERRVFYQPKGEGHEAKVKERLDRWAEMRARMQE